MFRLESLLLTCSKFIWKHKWIFYILMLTWALPYTIVSLLVSLVLLIFGFKPIKTPIAWHFRIKKYWGGIELGLVYIRDTTSYDNIDKHEMGHSFQIAILGIFFLFIIGLPSIIRYWYRYFKYEKKELPCPTKYDAIWFEHSATIIGYTLFCRK